MLFIVIAIVFILTGCLANSKNNCPEYSIPVETNITYDLEWIPPKYFTIDGTIDGSAQNKCKESGEVQDSLFYVPFPKGCLSVFTIYVDKESVTAYVEIYDLYGELTHRSIQTFGYCGEFKNKKRKNNVSSIRFLLIWNGRNLMGNRAMPGTYIWKVTAQYKSGEKSYFSGKFIRLCTNTPDWYCKRQYIGSYNN